MMMMVMMIMMMMMVMMIMMMMAEQAWEVVARVRTPQEIREEYEAIARAREERRLQQMTNPSSEVSMTVRETICVNIPSSVSLLQVNATDLFDRYLYEPEYDEYIESGFPELEVSKLSLNQSIQVSHDEPAARG